MTSTHLSQPDTSFCTNKVTVGTQAAVLAGLDITMFIEFNPPDNEVWVCSMVKNQTLFAENAIVLFFSASRSHSLFSYYSRAKT
jgi:hypothetical protein